MVHSSKKRKSGGKYKGRGGKSFQSPRSKPSSDYEAPPQFSMRDEVFNTGRGNHSWSRESRLRNKGITFVSAGNLVGSLPEVDDDDGMDDEFAEDFHVDLGFEEEESEEVEEIEDKGRVEEVTIAQSSRAIAKLSLDNTESDFRGTASPPPPFVVDTKPSIVSIPKMPPPQMRTSSPTPSDSSDEVVFRGRNAPRVVADPLISTASSQPQSQMQSRSQSSRREDSSTEQSIMVTAEVTKINEVTKPRTPAWDPTPVEWVHRSKPGIGWSRPKTLDKKQDLIAENRRLREEAEAEAMEDYAANIQQAFAELAERPDLEQVTMREFSAMVDRAEERMIPEDANSNFPVGSYNDAEDEEEDDEDDEESDDDESFDSDEDSQGEEDNRIERKIANMTDEHIARLLAKQEDLGLGSDELLIFDDSDGDMGFDGLDDRNFNLPQLPAAGSRGQQKKKKGKRGQRDTFPSASLFADVLDQDPYNGFDIMDFDRPSLRPKKKGRKFEDDVPLDLDEDLLEMQRTTWEKDREKKRLKKAERAELRSQGLLGRGKHGKPDLSMKYEDGMSLDNFRDELRQFLASTSDNLALPPMDKHLRKGVHEIAMEFGLKSKSIGSGKNRYPKLLKTKNTIAFDDEIWLELQQNINRGFFARLDRRGKGSNGKASKKMTRGGGAAMAGVKYRDGEVVGAAAPEIGIDNRGRAMLEKMGWSKGMALGTATNQGILQPIAHTVKTSKAGLG